MGNETADRADVAAVPASKPNDFQAAIGRVWPRLVVTFAVIAACLWGFGAIAGRVLVGEPFAFDGPLLQMAHSATTPVADNIFIALSAAGYAWGVIPADIALIVWLALRRRLQLATFAFVAVGGSALLNIVAKQTFRRERPALWVSAAPEITYSFPSAHAMGSATLATVVVLLAWRTRYRWAAVVLASFFVLSVGVGRVYLGVHYPSDICAGWAAAIAWSAGAHALIVRPRGNTSG